MLVRVFLRAGSFPQKLLLLVLAAAAVIVALYIHDLAQALAAYLFGDEKTLAHEVDRILLEGVRYGRHIFNLGHGVFPEADPQKLHWLTDYVHERSREIWAQER
mgnify:CR=1 FL=1